MANAENVRLQGAWDLTWKGNDLGHTHGGITLTYEPEHEDLKVDKWAGPVDVALVSENLTITTRLAEPVVSVLRHVVAAGNYESSGPTLEIGRTTGHLGSTVAGHLRCHPTRLSGSDQTEDIHIYRAVPVDEVELEYTVDDQTVFEVTWKAIVDEDKTDGSVLGHVGPGVS